MNFAIVAAGGKGKRFQTAIAKQLYPLKGRPVLSWSMKLFEQEQSIQNIYLAYPMDDSEDIYRKLMLQENWTKVILVKGGETRYHSVRNAFDAIRPFASPDNLIVIHDAARPLLSAVLLKQLLETAEREGTAIPVLPITETMKQVEAKRVIKTLPRQGVYVAQTPQVFRYHLLRSAYELSARLNPYSITDEAMMVEMAGFAVVTVKGEKQNIKITEHEDLELVEYYLTRRESR